MSQQPLAPRPLSDGEKKLREKFHEHIAAQSDLMDKLSERLLTVEMAIPGLYATVLKLVRGDKAAMAVNTALYLTFACWLGALALTLAALTPRKWLVDPTILRQDPKQFAAGLGLEDYFDRSALYKRRLVTGSSVLFFLGICCAVFTWR